MDYTRSQVLAILDNLDEIEAYIERVTPVLTEIPYTVSKDQEFEPLSEGHTLWNYASMNSRSVARNGFKEQLLDMLVDIRVAQKKLADNERLALWAIYIAKGPGRPAATVKETADIALSKLLFYLNGIPDDDTLFHLLHP